MVEISKEVSAEDLATQHNSREMGY